MSDTRYGHSNVGGGNQDQAERKDEGWQSRQGGDESAPEGRRGDAQPQGDRPDRSPTGAPPQGTNTQGELAGIGEASRDVAAEEARGGDAARDDSGVGIRERDARGAGTDQPPRMGGPLGPDAGDPHLPEGAQNSDNRGSGAGGFDQGVNAKVVGAVHQGVKEEDV